MLKVCVPVRPYLVHKTVTEKPVDSLQLYPPVSGTISQLSTVPFSKKRKMRVQGLQGNRPIGGNHVILPITLLSSLKKMAMSDGSNNLL